MTAIDDIAAERKRQITKEGWTVEHDDSHGQGQLARAAAVYAYASTLHDQECKDHANWLYGLARGLSSVIVRLWPWEPHWFKWKGDPRRRLVKAGALIVAEIERLDRAAMES